jgi:hypothetical protein
MDVNNTGKCGTDDANLTQTGSGFDLEDTRRDLIAMRTRLGDLAPYADHHPHRGE